MPERTQACAHEPRSSTSPARASSIEDGWLRPGVPLAPRVRAFVTTRHGGVSIGPFASLNLGYGGDGVGDDVAAVDENRRRVQAHLPARPTWLRQVHGRGVRVVDAPRDDRPEADAAVTTRPDVPLVVLVADCLPVVLAARDGSGVGVAHAGWRGLAGGVVEATLAALAVPPADVSAWLGPCIGPRAFEVRDDVRDAFLREDAASSAHFAPLRAGKWLADLSALARRRLARAGVHDVQGGGWCTVEDDERFFSYRRNRITGRMGAFVYLEGPA